MEIGGGLVVECIICFGKGLVVVFGYGEVDYVDDENK